MFVFLFLAFVASFAGFNRARDQLKTPLIFNLLGSFCIWAGPWAAPALGRPVLVSLLTCRRT